mmetsp:Transcript_51149/g.158460  ORF Transcript_51149/g.158460 Transcript_51149/m.158460 type:complete len:227 (-) Transcript_51149:203-883(-)
MADSTRGRPAFLHCVGRSCVSQGSARLHPAPESLILVLHQLSVAVVVAAGDLSTLSSERCLQVVLVLLPLRSLQLHLGLGALVARGEQLLEIACDWAAVTRLGLALLGRSDISKLGLGAGGLSGEVGGLSGGPAGDEVAGAEAVKGVLVHAIHVVRILRLRWILPLLRRVVRRSTSAGIGASAPRRLHVPRSAKQCCEDRDGAGLRQAGKLSSAPGSFVRTQEVLQ